MRRPCPISLSMSRVPAKKWETREDLMRQIELARKWIGDEPGRFTLDQIAALAAISPYHFHRLFKATYGQTPQKYLAECRLIRAKELLESGEMNVAEACVEVGFSSASSFSRLYKSRFGVPPSQSIPGRSREGKQ